MSRRTISRVLPLVLCFALALVSSAPAQIIPGGGTGGFNVGGISIDADGVVKPAFKKSDAESLNRRRKKAKPNPDLPAAINEPSSLRKVSLVKLEAACEKLVSAGKPIPPEMFYLAGLHRIDYVFVYPEEGDVVVAGPAESFEMDSGGSVVGVASGRAALRLDDLIVALRSVPQSRRLYCSIDPQKDRLAAMQRFIKQNSFPATTAVIKRRYARMREILGPQVVSVDGVPADSHFARVMVAADYRMKLISIGLEKPPVKGLPSHLAMLRGGGNTMQRWWFTPLYDAFQTNEDGTAYQFNGQRAQLMSEQEFVDAAGNRSRANFTKTSTQRFSKNFTEKFPELVERVPVFGELSNLIDLAVLAALLAKEQIPERIGWRQAFFSDTERAALAKAHVPKQVDSMMNYKAIGGGRSLIALIGGGVNISPQRTLRRIEFERDTKRTLLNTRTKAKPADPARWWWD
jgi:hypothetical protein